MCERKKCLSVASHTSPTGDLAHNPGMCPDWDQTSDPLVHRPARELVVILTPSLCGNFFLYKGCERLLQLYSRPVPGVGNWTQNLWF